MANRIFTEYLSVDNNSISKDQIQNYIIEQIQSVHNFSYVNDSHIKDNSFGMIYSFEVIEDQNGYKVFGYSEMGTSTWVWLVFSFLFLFIGIFFIAFMIYLNNKKFEDSVSKVRHIFNTQRASSTSNKNNSNLEKLEKLHELKEKGVLSDKEYTDEKKKLLAS